MADSDEIQTDKEDSQDRARTDKLESMFETAMKAMKRNWQVTESSDYSDDNAYD